ncbi:MAG: hypothetical protein JWL77_4619 [Chthonomonadaceae bacterium]|nr:hypothetical protein [Chthonomonadaceae bacterium]
MSAASLQIMISLTCGIPALEAGICQTRAGPPPPRAVAVNEAKTTMIESGKTLVNGVEFHAACPSVWKSSAESETRWNVTLSFTNRGRQPLRFWLFDTLWVELHDGNGTALPIGGGRNRTKPGTVVSPTVAPAQSYALTRGVHLRQSAPNRFSLVGEDGFGGTWTATDLKPGKYRLILHYQLLRNDSPESQNCWRGETQTPPLTFEIR